MKAIKTRKGQAAITDALFFLLIIVTLSILMFRYSSTYGTRINQASSDLYYKEYTNSVLKTIFYTSAPLDFDLNLYSSSETDYLMTQVKQDFYANGKIGKSAVNTIEIETSDGEPNYGDLPKYNLFHTIKASMFPLKSHDYLFYLYNADDSNFAYFMIKNTNFDINNSATLPTNATARGIKSYMLSDEPYTYYLCKPEDYETVRSIISKSPKIFSSSIPLSFVHNFSDNTKEAYITYIITATFAMWPATADINSTILKENLDCKEVED